MNSAHSRVAGKTAVVTGGRGDIGATAALLAEHGAKVASLDVAGIPAAVAQGNITESDVDITSEESVADVIRRVIEDIGPGHSGQGAPNHRPSRSVLHGLRHRLRHPRQRQH